MDIFTKWYHSNQVDFSAPRIKSIADFLLFSMTGSYSHVLLITREATADKLGNSSINVRKDENLTHPLDGFHRDRPKGQRGIPSWYLSLALHQLTKAPFEPLKEASLKHLTFQTVFLLALGSGKTFRNNHFIIVFWEELLVLCSCYSSVQFIKRPSRDACLHMGGILAEGSAVSAGSTSLPTYRVFTSGWNFFKLGTYI